MGAYETAVFPDVYLCTVSEPIFQRIQNFWCVKLVGILTGLVLIPMLFYTYNGAIGKSPDWYNIAIFFISAAVTFILETWLLKRTLCIANRRGLPLRVFA